MITLNLLPKEEKIAYKQERYFNIIKNSLYLALIALILIATSLLGARTILEKNFVNIVENDSVSPFATLKIKNKVNNINKKLQEINEIQKDYFNFYNPVIELGNLLPGNVQINLLNLDKNKLTFSLKGLAKTRDDLLNFQKNLESSSIFKNIKFPLSNFFSKENIIFEFSGEFNNSKNSND